MAISTESLETIKKDAQDIISHFTEFCENLDMLLNDQISPCDLDITALYSAELFSRLHKWKLERL